MDILKAIEQQKALHIKHGKMPEYIVMPSPMFMAIDTIIRTNFDVGGPGDLHSIFGMQICKFDRINGMLLLTKHELMQFMLDCKRRGL